MKTMKIMLNIFTSILGLSLVSSLFAMDALEVVKKVNEREDGLSVVRDLKMELIDKRGKKRIRETISYRKYYGLDKKSVIYYKTPKRLSGTGFLTFDNKSKDDEQWLYLPSLRKVRRVSAANRGDWFLGTDFSYEDIKKETKISTVDFDFKILEEVDEKGISSYVLESIPKNKALVKELGYSKIISFIDKDIFIARKATFYDERGGLLKTLLNKDIRKVDNIWTIHHLKMENHQNKHVSNFYFSNVDYKKEVKDSSFTKASLKRRR